MTDVTTAAQELEDFDVEGHGIKEVALGLSAATIVAGGAGAASLALDNPLPGTTSGIAAAVAGVQGDLDRTATLAGGTASSAVDEAKVKVGDVQRFADSTGSFAISTTTPVADRATGLAADAVSEASALADDAVADASDLAGDLLADPFGTTDRAVDGAMGTVRDVRDDALGTARTTVSSTVTLADRTASSAVEKAGDVAETATTTVDTAYDAVGPSVDVSENDSGSTVTVEAAGKKVSVQTG